jgi:starch synthase
VSNKRNAAIFYEQEGFSTGGERLLGRQSAGESFLKGYLKFGAQDQLYCYTDHPGKFKAFESQIASWSDQAPPSTWINPMTLGRMSEPGCLFYSGPSIGPFAWQRRHIGSNSFSLCGLTHTISSMEVMDTFGDLAIAPFEEWDALICTSVSVKKTVEHVLANYSEYLEQRNGGKVKLPVQLPIIPLGINCDDFAETPEKLAWRKSFRETHNIGADDIVILYVGRLAAHAKAHPLPMYQALEIAAAKTNKKLHLVQAGWFATAAIENQFRSGARKFCPSVNCIFVDGRDMDVRTNIWQAADIFTSLSDNIQETFGITPVEAMAAGLPIVATDWDGYRETVRHGIDGLLVRTTMPAAGCGLDLAYRYQVGIDSYDRYVGQVGLFTNVDTQDCANAYLTLIEDSALRKKMGAAGKARANAVYDWNVLIPTYQDLWTDLADRRTKAETNAFRTPVPLRDDPFKLFAHYPTEQMKPQTRIRICENAVGNVEKYLGDTMGNGASIIMPNAATIEDFVKVIADADTMSLQELATAFKMPIGKMIRIAGWLAKMNLVSVVKAE